MAWLLRDDEVLAALEVASTPRARLRGLLGRDSIDGAFLLRPCRAVHTLGMRFPIDVAFCDGTGVVLATRCVARHRVAAPVWRARWAIEAEAGAFERWRLRPGDRVEVRGEL